ncbi:S-adenosyl-L-methionine-dependent methyltransferase [Periconia macrospinosa]|uniref:S-adenosyl-L-methionine-dependent methyltransferase n=1 Tax=Periconia macrospinosa TaxID=97972 RepID=A0A2V1DZX9_9PLEO|nr:S-adenosyl-L-methionine-dependent methyltransferase [Periconia macrospinosa]
MVDTTTKLSDKAFNGFAEAALYEQHRPSYPDEAVAALLDAARVTGLDAASLVDLGAGTGKFTELLASRPEHFKILAVEPHAQMRGQLAQKKLQDVTVVEGFSTAIPADSESIDAVFVAQAFHWFANRESLHEIHRVLKPLGALCLIWNAEDYNTPLTYPTTTPWSTRLRSYILDDLTPSTHDHEPRFRDDKWRDVFDVDTRRRRRPKKHSTPPALTATTPTVTTTQEEEEDSSGGSLFTVPLGERKVEWEVWLGKEELWGRLRTLSHFAKLRGEDAVVTRKTFNDILNASDAGVEKDDQGRIKVHGVTVLVWTGKESIMSKRWLPAAVGSVGRVGVGEM